MSAADTKDMLGNLGVANAAVKWTVKSYGVFYEDSGEEKVRLEFQVWADIKATDVVTFEVAWRPKSMTDPTDT